MVTYKCERCHKIFNHKGNYKSHLNRKKKCNLFEENNNNNKDYDTKDINNNNNNNINIFLNNEK